MRSFLLLVLSLSSLTANAAVTTYVNKIGAGKTLKLEATVNPDARAYADPATCDREVPEQYNDYTNEWEPAYTAHEPCFHFKFNDKLKLTATLTDDATGATEVTVVNAPIEFTSDAGQPISSELRTYHWFSWEILFPQMGYGIRVGDYVHELPVTLTLGAKGLFNFSLDFQEIVNTNPGREPFWCSGYDATATGAWFEINKGGDATLSPYRNANVCGTFKF